jgi:hypothetical protein
MEDTMQPADQLEKTFYVSSTAGAAVTGLVTGNFTVTAWHTPYGGTTATWTHGTVVSELGSGWYRARLTLPATAGQYVYGLTHASHIVTPFAWEDELEIMDQAAIAALVARPVVRVQGSGTLGETATLPDLIAFRKAVITISIVDVDNDPVALATDYTTWAVGFRSTTTQSGGAPRLDAVHGTPTGFGLVVDDAGLITITIPDDLSIFSAITEGTTPVDEITIQMEIVADKPSGQTVTIVAPSTLRIKKRAHGSGSA